MAAGEDDDEASELEHADEEEEEEEEEDGSKYGSYAGLGPDPRVSCCDMMIDAMSQLQKTDDLGCMQICGDRKGYAAVDIC